MESRISSPAGDRFPAHVLREYALVADGERGAVIGPRGDVAWMCAPKWHDDPVFSSLVGGRGLYAVTPVAPRFVWGGFYENGTLIWVSRWVSTDAVIECREALALPAQGNTAVMLRRIRAVDGRPSLRVTLDARAAFGRHPMERLRRQHGIWTGQSGPLHVRWTGAEASRRRRDGSLSFVVEVEPGMHHDLVLEISTTALDGEAPDASSLWTATEAEWSERVPDLERTVGTRDARQAYAVLQGLTSASGGMVAAATLGLPERATRGRSYDYRYAWIRDQSYAAHASAACGQFALLDQAVGFISERVLDDGPQLKPAYRVDGTPVPSEREIKDVDGYPGGTPRVGNHVNRQFQLDAIGDALLVFAAAAREDRLETGHWKAAEAAAAAVARRWREPDAGIWEIDNHHWAHSRLNCVAGLRALAGVAGPSQAAEWSSLADRILSDVAGDCVHPSGRWQRAPDDARVDASLLIPPIRGALPFDDPRTRATVEAVERELNQEGFVYRYKHRERPLSEAEGAFLLCGFLLALSAIRQGRIPEAVAWFERNRTGCGSPGLFTEEFDVVQRQLRGNLPQAFVHALLLECASELATSWPGLSVEGL